MEEKVTISVVSANKEPDINANPECEKLSKRAQKRLKKRQEWLDTKAERKEIQKQKRKAKIEQNKAEGKFEISYSARRKRLKNSRMDSSNCKVNVVIDMSFDDLMHDRDLGKCLKQLMHCYCLNRRLADPVQFHVSSLTGRSKAEMDARHSGYTNWDVNFHQDSYVETFTSAPYSKSLSDIVYLTSESENVIGSTLDPSKIYIIGGLVDHNHHKGLCHNLAIEKRVSHARLPIDEYIDMKTRRVLTIDHVFQIISKVASEGLSWKDSFLLTLPARKGAIGIDDDDEEENQSKNAEEEDNKHKENEKEAKDKGSQNGKEEIKVNDEQTAAEEKGPTET